MTVGPLEIRAAIFTPDKRWVALCQQYVGPVHLAVAALRFVLLVVFSSGLKHLRPLGASFASDFALTSSKACSAFSPDKWHFDRPRTAKTKLRSSLVGKPLDSRVVVTKTLNFL